MKKSTIIIISIILVIGIFLVWGLIGASQSKSVGVTCDFGINDDLCWKWHKNALGQFAEGIDDFINNR